MSTPQPPAVLTPGCQLWPVDPGCLPAGWTEDPGTWPPEQVLAMGYASDYLHQATGRAYGVCLEYIRPCRRPSGDCMPTSLPSGAPFTPVLWDGRVLNIGCGCVGSCGCGPLCQIPLPGKVYAVASVKVDGQVVSPATYRVDNHRRLVRTVGCWPDCQDLNKPDTEPGTFSVWYWEGTPIPPLGRFAVTQLAIEFSKYCNGDTSCSLPRDVTEVVLNGMTYSRRVMPGVTGIKLVDDWVALANPHGNTEPGIQVWTPDLDYGVTPTWPMSGVPMPTLPPTSTPQGYRYVQAAPQLVWTITHNLGWYPGGIQVEDGNGQSLGGPVIDYPDINTVRLKFNTPTSGVAYLS